MLVPLQSCYSDPKAELRHQSSEPDKLLNTDKLAAKWCERKDCPTCPVSLESIFQCISVLSLWEAETDGANEGKPGLQGKFQDNQNYTVRHDSIVSDPQTDWQFTIYL